MGFNPQPGDPPPLDPSGQPWQNPQPGAFPGTDNNKFTGASRQIGEFGGYPVGQVDVRTDMMKQLEQGALPMLLKIMSDPGSVSKMFGSLAGAVPGVPASGLSSYLFGGPGAPAGPPGPGQGPLPGGGGPPPGGGSGSNPVPPPPAQPWQDMPGITPPQGGEGTLFGNVNIDALNQILSQGGYGGQIMNAANVDRSQLGPAYADDEYWKGFQQNHDGFGYYTNTSQGGKLEPAYNFANPQQLMGYFMDPSRFAQPHADYTKKDTSGGKISPGEWDRWVEMFQKGQGQQLATGGILDPTKPALVGEQGPEIIAPGAAGQQQVMPLGGMPVLKAGGGVQMGPGPMPISPGMGGGTQAMPFTGTMPISLGAPSNGVQMGPGPMPISPGMAPKTTATSANAEFAGGPTANMTMMQPQQGAAAPGATGQFQATANQGPGTGSIQQLLMQNPEMDAFNASKNILMGQNGILGSGGGGQGVLNALQPLFQQNLRFGLNELTNRVPSVRNSGAAIEGADLTSRAMNDFNLMGAQAMQQGQQNTLGGLGMLGQLAGQAGNGAFGRNLQAGQLATQRDLGLGSLGLQQQQQQWNQTVNPTLQLLLAAMGMATPTGYQTVVPGKK